MKVYFDEVKVCNQLNTFAMTTTNAHQERRRLTSGEEPQEVLEKSWIELVFRKRECIKFLSCASTSTECLTRCRCGRLYSDHHYLFSSSRCNNDEDVLPLGACAQNFAGKVSFVSETRKVAETSFIHSFGDGSSLASQKQENKWNIMQHTALFPTDAHGTLEFQGTGEGDKAKYIRLSHDTSTDAVLKLLYEKWKLSAPKMVITVHGGAHNFQLQPKLHRYVTYCLCDVFFPNVICVPGVGVIVGDALKEHKMRSRGKIVSIGVAPWGVVDHREDLIGSEQISSYQTMENPLSKGSVLHTAHTHFLLVDNGTEGRYDSELRFRRQLEKKLTVQPLKQHHGRTSVVCLVLEGGKNTINVVLESVRQIPPIPVIVCDGSGRAADLLAFAHQYVDDDGSMMEELRVQLLALIQETFKCNRDQAQYFYLSIMDCVKKKDLITVFRMGKGFSQDDIDIAILTASLKAQSTSAPDMLNMALSWNRIDIAKSQIFVYGRKWPVLSLEQAMLNALINDRVDFVKLLMENGVSMHKFLTVSRLEELYNAKLPVHLMYLLHDVRKNIPPGYRFNLIDVGQVIEMLMGGAYRSNYTRKRFRSYYASKVRSESSIKKQLSAKIGFNSFANLNTAARIELEQATPLTEKREPEPPQFILPHFAYPFHELMIWAVLMKRQKMALFMWQQGEEAIAKALVASKLYKMMAKEASDDDLDLEESDQLRQYSKEFQDLSMQLLEICYHADDAAAKHLLTYELKHWSRQTCLSLAVSAKQRDFIAHPCVQLLINDLWMGGLNERKNSVLKVIMGILVPPTIVSLDFKTQDQLKLMPQRLEEHLLEVSSVSSLSDGSSSSSSASSSSSSSSREKSVTNQQKPDVLGRPFEQDYNDAYSIFMNSPKQLSLSQKIYEFYNAPIAKFWMHTMAFVALLLMFTYVCLIRMTNLPSVYEWIVISHVITFAIEKVREIVVSEPSGAIQKIKVWIVHFWNLFDAVTTILFLVGLGFRLAQDPYYLQVGRAIYCVDIVFWYIYLLNIFSVNKHLGPYIMLMGKMMVDMLTFIILLATVLCSFGVARQAILHPNENSTWIVLKDVFLEPYFMLYGEVYAGTIDPCFGTDPSLCVIGSWIVPILMTIYLLVANILLINLLIAVFNNTFARGKKYSDRIWRFQRYLTVVEYELRPVFPPPIILVSYLVMIMRWICKKRKSAPTDRVLKLFLNDTDVEKLHDFEEDCVDEYLRRKGEGDEKKMNNRTQESLDRLLDSLDEMRQRECVLTNHILDVHERIFSLEEAHMKLHDIQQINLLRSRHNTGGMSDPWSVQEEEEETPRSGSLMRPIPPRALLSLRHRRRARQDSEMSTASDWHQQNFRHRTISQDQSRLAPPRVNKAEIDYPLRRTNSTGMISVTKHSIDSSDRGYSNYQPNSQLSVANLDSKSLSCQDIMLAGSKKSNPSIIDEIRTTSAKELHRPKLTRRFSLEHPMTTDSEDSAAGDSSSPGMFVGVQDSSPPEKDESKAGQSVFNFSSIPPPTSMHASLVALPQATSCQLEPETTIPRNKSFNDRLSGGRKFMIATPIMGIPPSPVARPTYQSITDQIDTSRWHEMNAPKVPSTPMDAWWTGKGPDFDYQRPIKFSDQNSLIEWEEDGDGSGKKKGRSKHRKRLKRNKKVLTELPETASDLHIHANTNNNSDVDPLASNDALTFPRSRRNVSQFFNKLVKSKSQTISTGADSRH